MEPFEELTSLDKLVHEPARLAIMTALAACERADFLYLQRITGLTKGNLSGHISRLEKGELLTVEKDFDGKIPRTTLALTEKGRETIVAYWEQMERLREAVDRWRPGEAPA
ncbi:MAG: transcriptional regulator [Chloroflexi bacterium]|nr:transcriptional regulator [Chloroflexota bacterium]